jgi:2-polyprenyl-3-methyl-5-hydroxy-6-metoxy-1,4-benzoquinol methylase
MNDEQIKQFYTTHADKINEKRSNSPYPLRRYVHWMQYKSILCRVTPGATVLDAGCGEGNLSILMAQKGAQVTGVDISVPNIQASRNYAREIGVMIHFETADLEKLPFPDNSFDVVVSSHVLEHLPSFDKGLQEIMRVTKKRAIIAIPTILNGCSLVQVGGGMFWLKGKRIFTAIPFGLMRLALALLLGREGVNEHYAGSDVPHVFRFPAIMRKKINELGYKLVEQEASTLALPYFASLLPVSEQLDRLRNKPVFRELGYGTTFVVEK